MINPPPLAVLRIHDIMISALTFSFLPYYYKIFLYIFKSKGPTVMTNHFGFFSSPLGEIKFKPLSSFDV